MKGNLIEIVVSLLCKEGAAIGEGITITQRFMPSKIEICSIVGSQEIFDSIIHSRHGN
jgi:hypothetical protein